MGEEAASLLCPDTSGPQGWSGRGALQVTHGSESVTAWFMAENPRQVRLLPRFLRDIVD